MSHIYLAVMLKIVYGVNEIHWKLLGITFTLGYGFQCELWNNFDENLTWVWNGNLPKKHLWLRFICSSGCLPFTFFVFNYLLLFLGTFKLIFHVTVMYRQDSHSVMQNWNSSCTIFESLIWSLSYINQFVFALTYIGNTKKVKGGWGRAIQKIRAGQEF